MFDAIRIVLVGTSHPGNIGGAARAMKNMGLSDLWLVAPRAQFPHPEATLRSSGADDLLAQAQVVDQLADALSDCTLVAGTSARSRHLPWPLINPRQLAQRAATELTQPQARLALVFGREDRGLSNEELHLCHCHVHIPTNPAFSSLNLAAAVQVLAYELRMALSGLTDSETEDFWGTAWDSPRADHQTLERFFNHLEATLTEIDFHDPDNPRQLMSRLRRLYLRARPDTMEVNILRGILTATQKASAQDSRKPTCSNN